MKAIDVQAINRAAWDKQVAAGNRWTLPVDAKSISLAKQGDWSIVLTPARPVPAGWFGELPNADVLCLAGGGGQQGPLLAAAGARVTVFDNSPSQLAQDEMVRRRDDLNIDTVEGDMRDLSAFADESFDIIVHPCSNTFVPDPIPVWQETYRVLRPGGRMMSGFCNPVVFMFDYKAMVRGQLVVRHSIPFSDPADLPPEELQELMNAGEPLCFGHTLESQIGGQTRAGFVVADFYEDKWTDDAASAVLSKYISGFAATLAIKLPATAQNWLPSRGARSK